MPVGSSVLFSDEHESFEMAAEVVGKWIEKHPELMSVNRPMVLTPRPADALLPVHKTGTHALLINRRVVEAIKPPWFQNTDPKHGGEDFYFMSRARELGFAPHVDLSTVAGHVWGDWSIGALEFMVWNQVTNWSFKDQRLRRNIIVGVAYGSDTELVRETLLEIAKGHTKVLKRPKPDVLFQDFGDSALVFKLRLWTTIDHFVSVETDVRFAIDQLFRERGIEISFPQRDIHIRSTVEKSENKEIKEIATEAG